MQEREAASDFCAAAVAEGPSREETRDNRAFFPQFFVAKTRTALLGIELLEAILSREAFLIPENCVGRSG